MSKTNAVKFKVVQPLTGKTLKTFRVTKPRMATTPQPSPKPGLVEKSRKAAQTRMKAAKKATAKAAKAKPPIIPMEVQRQIAAKVSPLAAVVATVPQRPKVGDPLPKGAYYTANGTKVPIKGKVGDTVAGRRISDFEPDGRVIFAKVAEAAPVARSVGQPAAAPKSAPYDPNGVSRINTVSVDLNDYEAEESFEGDSLTVLKKLANYTDANYADRNVRLGVNIIGPAPRILAVLTGLLVKK